MKSFIFNKNCKITVVTGYTSNIKHYGELATATKYAYCSSNNINLVVFCDEDFDKSRKPAWSKIKFIERVLNSEEFNANWIFWSDADALFLNHSVDISTFINENYDFILSKDFNNYNTGNFLMKNCDLMKKFLKDIWNSTQFLQDPWFEQAAVIHLLKNKVFLDRTLVVEQKLFNSYPDNGTKIHNGLYKHGDFVIHFPGKTKERIDIKAEFMKYIKQVELTKLTIHARLCL